MSNRRPRIDVLPWTPLRIAGEIAALAALAGTIAVWAHYRPLLPESIPSHFDLSGEVDAWGSPDMLVWVVAISAALWLAMTVLSRFPHIYNYPVEITPENAPRQYRLAVTMMTWLKATTGGVFGWIVWSVCQTAVGATDGLSVVMMLVAIAALPAVVVVYVIAAGSEA